jgi:hypothetical protein
MSGHARTRWAILVAVVLVVLTAACGDDDGGSSDASSTSAASTTTATTTPSSTAACISEPSTDPQTAPAQSEFALLEAVRSAGHACTDRVTFEFRGDGQPGYTVGYEPGPIVADGSGDPVAVEGSVYLVVRLQPASGFDSDTSMPTYDGPARVEPTGASFVTEVVRTGDFEGVLTWVIGLDQQRPFSVFRLSNPSRVYIDIG